MRIGGARRVGGEQPRAGSGQGGRVHTPIMCREGRSYVGLLRQKPPVRAAGSAPGTCRRADRRSIPGGPARPPASPTRSPTLRRSGSRAPARWPTSRLRTAAACCPEPPPEPAPARRGWMRSAPRSPARMSAPSANSSGSACCTGAPTDRYVSATSSSPASVASVSGPPTTIQPSFRCGRPHDFDSPPRLKTRAAAANAGASAAGETRVGSGPSGYGANTSSATIASSPRAAMSASAIGLVALDEPAGRVVGTRDDDGTRPRAAAARLTERLLDAREVEAPDAVERQPVGDRNSTLEANEVVVKRVARFGDQHRVARIAQQLEQERARFAGAGRDRHARGIDGGAGRRVFSRDRGARRRQPQRRGLVARGIGARHRGAQGVDGVGEPDPGRVRFGQVEKVAAQTAVAHVGCERVLRDMPGKPRGEHLTAPSCGMPCSRIRTSSRGCIRACRAARPSSASPRSS